MAFGKSSPAIPCSPPLVGVADDDGHFHREVVRSNTRSTSFSLHGLIRITHEWTAIIVAVPLIFIMVTGIFLQLRKPVEWIQPSAAKGAARFDPQVVPADVLAAVRAVPEMKVESWDDVLLLDYRPKKGIIKARNPGHFETQVDAKTGAVLKKGQRWNDIVMYLHDGSTLGLQYLMFIPVGFMALYLLISGFYLGVRTTRLKMRVRASRRNRHGSKRGNGQPARKRAFNFSAFCRRYHYWLAIFVVVPWFIVICSGLVLQLRDHVPGVLPEMKQGSSTTPTMTYDRVLEVARTIPEMGISDWSDIWRVYTYPSKGVMTIRTKRDLMAQIDSTTGAVLDVSPRSADFWEDIHQGIFGRHQPYGTKLFGDTKVSLTLTLFLPVHIIALFLWFTGVFIILKKRLGTRSPV